MQIRAGVITFFLFAMGTAFAQSLVSSDGDGVPDLWKSNGYVDVSLGGHTARIDLARLNVRKGMPTVLVWVDWMAAADHSHRPMPATDKQPAPPGGVQPPIALENRPLQRLVRSFAASGVNGGQGITLALIFADQVSWSAKNFQPIPERTALGASNSQWEYDWTDFDAIRASRFPPALSGIAHYAAFIHQMGGPPGKKPLTFTGLSRTIPGSDFLVSLGALPNQTGDADDQAGTFMHELGHNLGLRHGGKDDLGYKPNYLSVMNYLFQRVGVSNLGMYGHFDYSRFRLPDVDEQVLSNLAPITDDLTLLNYGTAHVCPAIDPSPCGSGYATPAYGLVWQLNCPVDWKCSSGTGTDQCPLPTGVNPARFAQDVNGDGCTTVLSGFDDWNHLVLAAPKLPGGDQSPLQFGQPTLELDALRPTLLTSMTVSQVRATQVDGGTQISWTRIPLQRVLGYEVLRAGPTGKQSIVRRTRESEFFDQSGAPGTAYTYSVRPVFAIDATEEIAALAARVPDTVTTEAHFFEERARRLSIMSPTTTLVRGWTTKAPGTVKVPAR